MRMLRISPNVLTFGVICWLLLACDAKIGLAQNPSGYLPWSDGDMNAKAADAWKTNQLGMDHSVPLPWTVMKVDGSTVGVWNRKTCFNGKMLPQQIYSGNVPLLKSPISISIEDSEGKVHTLDSGSGKVTSQYDDCVVWQGRSSTDLIDIIVRVQMEFDGFTWVELTIQTKGNFKISRLWFDVPMQLEFAQFYTKSFDGWAPAMLKEMWGMAESRKLRLQNFVLSNSQKGISFFSEGKKGWWLDNIGRQVEWVRDEEKNTFLVRYNIIDLLEPKAVSTPRKVSLGWNALPLKPMNEAMRKYVMVSITGNPATYKRYVDTGMNLLAVRLTANRTPEEKLRREKEDPDDMSSNVPIDMPQPWNIKKFKDYMERMKAVGKPGQVKIVIYTVGNHHNILDPRFAKNWKDWSATDQALTAKDIETAYMTNGQMPGSRKVCGWSQSFVDYKVWFMVHWAKELKIDGFYYDNQTFNSCINPEHASHAFTDERNRKLQVSPLLMYRQMAKRIYKAMKKQDPDCILVGHGIFPMYPFVDCAFGAEFMNSLAGDHDYYTSVITAEDCKGPFMNGHVYGIPYIWLPEYRDKYQYGPQSITAARAMLSLLWMTDSSYYLAYVNTDVLYKDMKVRGDFKIWESTWLPYWNQEIANTDRSNVHVTIYRRGTSALLIVSNPGQQNRNDLILSVNLNELFPQESNFLKVKIVDPLDLLELKPQQIMAMDQTLMNIPLDIKQHDYRIIRIDVE